MNKAKMQVWLEKKRSLSLTISSQNPLNAKLKKKSDNDWNIQLGNILKYSEGSSILMRFSWL